MIVEITKKKAHSTMLIGDSMSPIMHRKVIESQLNKQLKDKLISKPQTPIT